MKISVIDKTISKNSEYNIMGGFENRSIAKLQKLKLSYIELIKSFQ